MIMTTLFKNLTFSTLQIAIFVVLFCLCGTLKATTKEEAVKVGVIYNLTKFTLWPDAADISETFNLCVYTTLLNDGFDALEGKTVLTKPLLIQHNIDLNKVQTCQMVFIADDYINNMQTILKKVENLPILTISEIDSFIDEGGMVGLVRDQNHVGFEVNLALVNIVGLKMRAQLLKLAKRVRDFN